MKTIAALLLLCLATSATSAQPVYRCGNAYSQAPCTGGAALLVANDARSDAQRAEGRRVAVDERRLAAEMQRDRMAEEKAAGTPKGAGSLSGAELAKSSASANQRRDVGKKQRTAARQDGNAVVVVLGPNAGKRRTRAD
jgi:hypothetical protein